MTRFTSSGARRTGDVYQDLQSAEVLLEWLEQPDSYRWVRLETMQGSLDDIQGELSDGSRRLLQVKFSTRSSDEWGWAELMHKTAGRRGPNPSLLEKWKASLDSVIAEGIVVSDAALVTNRRAALEVRTHLDISGLVDLSGVPEPVHQQLVDHLGGPQEAEHFFGSFHFRFQQAAPEVLEESLKRRFFTLGGTALGWTNLVAKVQRWINHQDEPAADGTISLEDVKNAALWNLPPQIPQSFLVPYDYVAPERWSDSVVRPLIQAGGTVVVTGSPGAGKSTYLSWLADGLREDGIPVVRHHYYLSQTDSTSGRTDWETVAISIIGQLLSEYSDLVREVSNRNPSPDDLRDYMEAAGRERAGQEPLVVMVDGLDHVWRDTGSAEGLRKLFDILLPVPEGVVVVVGTQDVELARIPMKLKESAPHDSWLEIPELNRSSVKKWLRCHVGELSLPADAQGSDARLQELADAFFDVSGGHPLVLHYSLSVATARGVLPSDDAVRALPRFETGSSIEVYYRRLWDDIGAEGHLLLHLLAEFDWPWPPDGMVRCLSADADPAKYEAAQQAIQHVLGQTPAGVTVFHDSLRAFIRTLPSHSVTAGSLRGAVVQWLTVGAPEFWRWRFEWTERAKGGDAEPLMLSPGLDWCVDSLVAGRGLGEIAQIVAESAWAALESGRLDEATSRVCLDRYLSEAGYSEDVLHRLLWLSLYARDSRQADLELNLLLAKVERVSVADIRAIAEVAFTAGRLDVCRDMLDECAERWDSAVHSLSRTADMFEPLKHAFPLLLATTLSDADGKSAYEAYLEQHAGEPQWCEGDRYVRALALLCAVGDDTTLARRELRNLAGRSDGVPRLAADEVVRLAWRDGFDPTHWIACAPGTESGLLRCDKLWVRRQTVAVEKRASQFSFPPTPRVPTRLDEARFADAARAYFFDCLAAEAEGFEAPSAANIDSRASAVVTFLALLRRTAADALAARAAGASVGGRWFLWRLQATSVPAVKLNDLDNGLLRRHIVAQIVVAIAQDLEDLLFAETGTRTLLEDALALSIELKWTTASAWIEERVRRRLEMGEPSAAMFLADSETSRLAQSRGDLHTRARDYAVLGQFCVLNGLPSPQTERLRWLAGRNLLGHGYHKDTILFDVLAAVESLCDTGEATLARLRTIEPVIRVIDDITDGDETRYLPERLAAAAWSTVPEALPPLIRAYQQDNKHWEIQSFFTELAETMDLDDGYQRALAGTLVHDEALVALQTRTASGDELAAAVLADIRQHLGPRLDQTAGDEQAESEQVEAAPAPSPAGYPPENLLDFIQAVRDAHIFKDDPLAVWIAYWRPLEPERLLRSLTEYLEAHGSAPGRAGLQDVVELALEMEGPAAAWQWLVTYHQEVYGWSRGWSRSDEMRWIWRIVQSRFSDRWLEFIVATARPRWRSTGAPSWEIERMALFLDGVGERDLAERVVDAGVRFCAGLAADIRLPEGALALSTLDMPVELQLLVDRLDSPSRAVQERVGWWLAVLLSNEQSSLMTAHALVTWHDRERIEMRTCMLLLVLHLAVHANALEQARALELMAGLALVPSIGAETLLRELGPEGHALASELHYTEAHSGSPDSSFHEVAKFDTLVKGYLAPIFLRFAKTLHERGVSFMQQWQWEARSLADRLGMALPNPEYYDSFYSGGVDGPALAINDRVSVVLRSAYLRALHYFWSELPEGLLRWNALQVAVMADPAFWSIRSSSRPSWWPSDPGEAEGIDLLPSSIGAAIARGLEAGDPDHDEVVAYASGPVRVEPHVRADLTIRAFLQAANGPAVPAPEAVAAAHAPVCDPTPARLSMPGAYAPRDGEISEFVGDWLVAPLACWFYPGTADWLLPERYLAGVYLPAPWLFPATSVIEVESNRVVVTVDGRPVARFEYWNDDVRERAHMGAPTRVGVVLLVRREWLDKQVERGATLCWTAALSMAEREPYKPRFGPSKDVGSWLVGGSPVVRQDGWTPPS